MRIGREHTHVRTALLHTLTDLRNNTLFGTTELKISENLSQFPEEILRLADTLETLDLSNNKLSTLPNNFSLLKKLRTVFLSNNEFEQFPAVLSECPELDMIGIRNNGLSGIAENALPKKTRWLILTDNKIDSLPNSMGELTQLQKLMLAGNGLTSLPESMENCEALELLRISANQFQALPDFIFRLPKLSWLAFAGNPLAQRPVMSEIDLPSTDWEHLQIHEVLGEGASGVVSKASWVDAKYCVGEPTQAIVIKRYKGSLTSDGYCQDELIASIAAGQHPNLIPIVAHIDQPPSKGLVMHRLDSDYTTLGQPPNRETCTRDVFYTEQRLTETAVLKIADSVARTLVHLHDKNLCHGDLYAHNILTNSEADTLLSDFGAASEYTAMAKNRQTGLEKIEVRAFGYLLEDLLALLKPTHDSGNTAQLTELKNRCLRTSVLSRPTFQEIADELTQNLNLQRNLTRSVA